MQKILIVDYGMGNISSVKRKLDLLGANVTVSSRIEDFNNADKIILPGVGHFGRAMHNLKTANFFDVLNENVLAKKKPVLGICLGMQLMNAYSEEGEGNIEGLKWFDASVKKFSITDTQKYKVPHIGWNKVSLKKTSTLMNGIEEGAEFYFVHSFYCTCNNEADVLNTSDHEINFVAAIEKENLFGVQYHPEKSHEVGEKLIKNFIQL
jgi:imidazole glycerol-phosphate synthase subunit HisH